MANDSRKKTATFLGATIIALIIISFMFSGYQSLSRSTPDTIATVGSLPIKLREYRMEYNRQLKFYKQITGGKDLTSVQVERFNIKGATIRSLTNRKLMLLFAQDLGINPGNQEISEEIMKLPYFQTNGQFDITLYKNLLARNQYSPVDFETVTAQDITAKRLYSAIGKVPTSLAYQSDIKKFRSQRYDASMVKFPKNSLKKKIKVTSKQINKFLKEPKNIARAESMFIENKSKYDKKEQVFAHHILIKGNDAKKKIEKIYKQATVANFSKLANKHTEDPSGKKKGGKLGWFGRGQMVPEFEAVAFSQKPGTISKPVKTNFGYHIIFVKKHQKAKIASFGQHKKSIAKELIQSNLRPKINGIAKNLAAKIKKSFSTNNTKQINLLKKKYDLTFEKSVAINRLDGSTGSIKLKPNQLKTIFDHKGSIPKTFTFENPVDVTVVKISKNKKSQKNNTTIALAQKLQQDVIKKMSESIKTKVYLSE